MPKPSWELREDLLDGLPLLGLNSSDIGRAERSPTARRGLLSRGKLAWRKAALSLHPDRLPAGASGQPYLDTSSAWDHLQAWAENPGLYAEMATPPSRNPAPSPRGPSWWAHRPRSSQQPPPPPKPPDKPFRRVQHPLGAQLNVQSLSLSGRPLRRLGLKAGVARCGNGGTAYTISFVPSLPAGQDYSQVKAKLQSSDGRIVEISSKAAEYAWDERGGLSSISFRP